MMGGATLSTGSACEEAERPGAGLARDQLGTVRTADEVPLRPMPITGNKTKASSYGIGKSARMPAAVSPSVKSPWQGRSRAPRYPHTSLPAAPPARAESISPICTIVLPSLAGQVRKTHPGRAVDEEIENNNRKPKLVEVCFPPEVASASGEDQPFCLRQAAQDQHRHHYADPCDDPSAGRHVITVKRSAEYGSAILPTSPVKL
jgi:hypothetical protein